MKILSETDSFGGAPKSTVLTIGNFDGVHRGHQAILKAARQAADRLGVPLTVMTFDPHPATILHPDRAPGVLTPLPLKAHLLQAFRVDTLVVIQDSLKLLNLSPKEFVDTFLMTRLAPKAVIEGPNFTFGYGRSGTLQTLRELAAQRGFDVLEVPFTQINLHNDRRTVACSSSLIRDLLDKGQAAQAAEILTRPYRLLGKTIPGRGIGKTLGFPTANLNPSGQIIPSEGVYAGRVLVADTYEQICRGSACRPAAFSIGRAKTFVTDHPLLLEAHLLEDKVEDLGGKFMAMDFIRWIRGQQRFDSRQALIEQIRQDCRTAGDILSD